MRIQQDLEMCRSEALGIAVVVGVFLKELNDTFYVARMLLPYLI
jgi:hypothetical protein